MAPSIDEFILPFRVQYLPPCEPSHAILTRYFWKPVIGALSAESSQWELHHLAPSSVGRSKDTQGFLSVGRFLSSNFELPLLSNIYFLSFLGVDEGLSRIGFEKGMEPADRYQLVAVIPSRRINALGAE